eukprot:8019241-Ditylum_brightwellii.AAC.1
MQILLWYNKSAQKKNKKSNKSDIVPPDDRTLESESYDGRHVDMDNFAFVVFNNEQSKEEYEERMNKVDRMVENNFIWDKWNWNYWKDHGIEQPIPGLAIPDCYNRRHGLCEGVCNTIK